jgi:hypothetical protein
MKLLIQLNWTAGLGEVYSDLCELVDYAHKYKELGYETQLNFCFHGSHGTRNKYLDNPINLDEIFKIDNLDVFDKIDNRSHSHGSLDYDNLKCVRASGPGKKVGMHEWDAFVDVFPEEEFLYPKFKAQDLIRFQRVPIKTLEYKDSIVQTANDFSKSIGGDYDFLHIRNFDREIPNDVMNERVNLIFDKVKNSSRKFHLGSNNQSIIDKLSILPNVFIYPISDLNVYHNDHGYGHGSNLTQEFLHKRLEENLSEMVSIKNADRILSTTSYNWISSFITYGILKQLNENRFSWYNANAEDTTW